MSTSFAHAETLEEKFGKHVENKPRDEFLTVTFENDSIGFGSDSHYTNGIRVSWYDTGDKPPAPARLLDSLMPMFSMNNTTSVYYSLGQNLYTPKNMTVSTPDPKDRPYAAFLYGSMGLLSITENHSDNVEFTAGVIGPYALGKETQQFVHTLLNAQDPKGWDHQLRNEVGLMVSWERMWPEAYTTEIGNLHFRAAPYGGVTLGNIYTYASTGLLFQIVP
ncbi:MAG: lipid A deacylase LpxR family protein, partial [Alphaproteobacteria bacterium]|nr:lipid A deacylase LpxR family protein [Alphaproteobacteria bacterium]